MRKLPLLQNYLIINKSMKFVVDPQLFTKFPGLTVGVLVVTSLDNTGKSEEVSALIQKEEERIRKDFSLLTLPEHPTIEAWQKAYQTFGAKPKEHRSSVENLYRLVLQEVNLRHINMLVDIYNVISLKYMLPVGGEDLDKVKGDVALTFAGPQEPPLLLLGDKEPGPPHEGEVMYKDDISAICRRFNWREANRTKLTPQTTRAMLVIELLPPREPQEVGHALKELEVMVKNYCGGTSTSGILNATNNEFHI